MKNIILTAAFILCIGLTLAQVRTPAPSPMVKMEQMVGMTSVSLEYSRPGVKGRKIFGELVPFDKIWRTGANQATKVSFASDVMFNGAEVKAGTYALYTMPGKDKWTIMLNSDLSIGGNVGNYSTDTEVHRSTVAVNKLSNAVESLLLYVDDLRDATATLNLAWANTHIEIPMTFGTEKTVMATIEATMAGPTANDYYRAAIYYHDNDKDMDQAYEWISKATEMNPEAYWVATWKARILMKMGKKKDAVQAAQTARDMAKKAGNMDFVKINDDIIKQSK